MAEVGLLTQLSYYVVWLSLCCFAASERSERLCHEAPCAIVPSRVTLMGRARRASPRWPSVLPSCAPRTRRSVKPHLAKHLLHLVQRRLAQRGLVRGAESPCARTHSCSWASA